MDKYSKVLQGQVLGVSAVENTVQVRIPELTETVTIPLTYPYVSALSGIKFLPRPGDVVLLAHSPQLVPKIIGYELFQKQHLGDTQKALDKKLHYRQLESGDILLYSGFGETEIFLSNHGLIQMASGVNVIKLDSVRRTIESICGSYEVRTLNGVQVNGGYVQRIIPPNTLPQGIPGAVAFELSIDNTTGRVMEFKTGTVVDSLGALELGSDSVPKSFSLKVFEGILPLGEIYLSPSMMGLTSEGAISIDAPSVKLTSVGEVSVDAPAILLGGILAIHPAVRGDLLAALLTTLITEVVNLTGDFVPVSGQESAIAISKANVLALLGQITNLMSVKTKVD